MATNGKVMGTVRLEDQHRIDDEDDDGTAGVKPEAVKSPTVVICLSSLDIYLPKICTNIFEKIGSQQCEVTYQRCLKIDLEEARIPIVELEPQILLTYKDQVVDSCRAAILFEMVSGERAIIQLKAVKKMTMDHMKQFQFYMHHSGMEKGYLF
ncbi:MAG: hypothetical protein SGARI_005451 [Bacillariaceae sp.]